MSNIIFYPYFENSMPLDKPPTLFVILNSILMADNGSRVPILDVTEYGRSYIFDFTYPISSALDKAVFEKAWIDHFLQRRIGQETFTAFKLDLRARFNEIMPYYNPMFDALGSQFNMFAGDGYTLNVTESESVDRDLSDTLNKTETDTTNSSSSNTISAETSGTVDNRYSDTPQNQLSNVQNGNYLTDYTYNQNSGTSDTTNENEAEETTTRTGRDTRTTADDTDRSLTRTEVKTGSVAKTDALIRFMNETRNLYTAIYHDCDDLFYQLF